MRERGWFKGQFKKKRDVLQCSNLYIFLSTQYFDFKPTLSRICLTISGVQEEGSAADGRREFRVALPGEGAHLSLEPHGVPGDIEIRAGGASKNLLHINGNLLI